MCFDFYRFINVSVTFLFDDSEIDWKMSKNHHLSVVDTNSANVTLCCTVCMTCVAMAQIRGGPRFNYGNMLHFCAPSIIDTAHFYASLMHWYLVAVSSGTILLDIDFSYMCLFETVFR